MINFSLFAPLLAITQNLGLSQYRVVRPNGEVVWLLMNGSFSEQQGNPLLTGMVIDISHQKFMEERLCCESRRQHALCVQNCDPLN